MKVNTDRAALALALSALEPLFSAEDAVSLAVEDNALIIRALSSTSAARIVLPAEAETVGNCTTALTALRRVVATRTKPQLQLTLAGGRLVLCDESTEVAFAARDPILHADGLFFPAAPLARAVVSTQALLEAASAVAVAARKQNDYSALTNLQIGFFKDELRLAATDGYRLASSTVPADCAAANASVLVPPPALLLLKKLTALEAKQTQIVATEKNVAFLQSADGVSIAFSHQLPMQRFPAIEQLLEQEGRIAFTVDRRALYAALDLLLPFAAEEAGVRFACGADNMLHFSARNENGSAHTTVAPLSATDWEPIALRVNLRFLAEGARSLPSSTVQIFLSAPVHPLTMRSDDGRHLHMIMPMTPDEDEEA